MEEIQEIVDQNRMFPSPHMWLFQKLTEIFQITQLDLTNTNASSDLINLFIEFILIYLNGKVALPSKS